jgi:hypothetical protein
LLHGGRRWLAEFPELKRSVVSHEKGAHIFTRSTAGESRSNSNREPSDISK